MRQHIFQFRIPPFTRHTEQLRDHWKSCKLANLIDKMSRAVPFLISLMIGVAQADTPQGQFVNLNFSVGDSQRTAALWLPSNYDPAKSWPLIVFLHGGGGNGDNNGDAIGWIKQWKRNPLLTHISDLPALVAIPRAPKGHGWADSPRTAQHSEWVRNNVDMGREHSISHIDAAIDAAQSNFAVDPLRITIMGFSMGGYGTVRYGALRTDRLAALAPIAGFGTIVLEDAKVLSTIPIWAIQGDQDQLVPAEQARRMVQAIEAAGGDVRYTEYEGAGHKETFRRALENSEVFEWLLEQKKD